MSDWTLQAPLRHTIFGYLSRVATNAQQGKATLQAAIGLLLNATAALAWYPPQVEQSLNNLNPLRRMHCPLACMQRALLRLVMTSPPSPDGGQGSSSDGMWALCFVDQLLTPDFSWVVQRECPVGQRRRSVVPLVCNVGMPWSEVHSRLVVAKSIAVAFFAHEIGSGSVGIPVIGVRYTRFAVDSVLRRVKVEIDADVWGAWPTTLPIGPFLQCLTHKMLPYVLISDNKLDPAGLRLFQETVHAAVSGVEVPPPVEAPIMQARRATGLPLYNRNAQATAFHSMSQSIRRDSSWLQNNPYTALALISVALTDMSVYVQVIRTKRPAEPENKAEHNL